jgi:hypothetical protein
MNSILASDSTRNSSESTERFVVPHSKLLVPVVRGVIERRVLVNYRVEPWVLARLVPAPFRPKLVGGFGVAGICLIRLRHLRPSPLPALIGFASENAAHRIAVEWEDAGETREGVFIPRRDSDSLLNCVAGGRVLPGTHHRAAFRVWATGERFKLEMRSADGSAFVRLLARVAEDLSAGSVFRTREEASRFFRGGAVGWSVGPHAGRFDGLELRCREWRLEPLAVDRVESSFFADPRAFPTGAAVFDSAFLMRNIEHEWVARGRLFTTEEI